MLQAYYIHFHGNSGEIVLRLRPGGDFRFISIEYCQDVLLDLKDMGAKPIPLNDLPSEVQNNFDFNRNRNRDGVREVYQLH